MAYEDLQEFVKPGHPENRHTHQPTWHPEINAQGRWRALTYDELLARDKVNLDIFWLPDESLEETDSLPEPDILAEEILEDLEAVVEQIRAVMNGLDEEPQEYG